MGGDAMGWLPSFILGSLFAGVVIAAAMLWINRRKPFLAIEPKEVRLVEREVENRRCSTCGDHGSCDLEAGFPDTCYGQTCWVESPSAFAKRKDQ
jgi:hypothetical protein